MALRPAKCYSRLKRPNTRVSKHKPRKSYVKGVPYPKIRSFEAGKKKVEYSIKAFLVTKGAVQIRHNALEAARIAANKALETKLGSGMYFLKIRVFPHHVLRDNPIATGAGADRYQTGMRLSFGRPTSTAAQVSKNQKIIEVHVSPGKEGVAKRALKVASAKMPIPCSIVFE
ncbi:MAG: 50S ribosomal protein L16 [Candidatus Aenigmarchaeota archaeon]|nr:50S ribosomal protein L16 [Candidatus Aenigmarchaeota archaeon]